MPVKPKKVERYLEIGCGRCEYGGTPKCKVQSWLEELSLLREIILESGLKEEIKWSAPCYSSDGKNILMMSALRESVVISFFHGAEMKDKENILEKPGENSRFVRYMRFTEIRTIIKHKAVILNYIQEAIDISKAGEKSVHHNPESIDYPEELVQYFEMHPDFEDAFSRLSPGRKRGYLIYFSTAKQSKTKVARIEKCVLKIMAGKGWNEL